MPSLPSIVVGVFGCGVVGSGTIRTLIENAALIERRLGARIDVRRVCVRDLSRSRDCPLPSDRYTTDPGSILADPEVRIVVELMGGIEPARSFIREAIRAGKHVVTANKELLACDGHDLIREAEERRLDFFFEGSVAGGIPIIRALEVSLAGNRISEILGIVNGTTNYILTRMSQKGQDFAHALAEAQARGYAEADPTSDVDGHDAAYKLAILAGIAFHTRVPVEQVYREGIRGIADRDIAYARDLGYVIKLVALAREREEGLELRVHPTLLPASHPLSAVNDVYNAIHLRGNAVDETMFFGRGAGSLPTGSSVVADIMEAARGILHGGSGRVRSATFQDLRVLPMGEVECNYYVRTETADRPGVIGAIGGVFGRHGVSLESVLQKLGDGTQAEIVWIAHRTRESRMQTALAEVAALPEVVRVANCIRVEE